jgi:hypothetical protein
MIWNTRLFMGERDYHVVPMPIKHQDSAEAPRSIHWTACLLWIPSGLPPPLRFTHGEILT